MNSRRYIGIDISSEYVALAKNRIKDYYKRYDELSNEKEVYYEVNRVVESV
jgi:DNA modification methylase